MVEQRLLPIDRIEGAILLARENKVILDSDLAFQLTHDEYAPLRSQIATLKTGRGEHRTAVNYDGAELLAPAEAPR